MAEQPKVVEARKKPPPETDESIRSRSFVLLSFWAIIIFLGLPIWWWTTSIHRATLPLQTMLDWADGKVLSSFLYQYSYTNEIAPRHVSLRFRYE